MDIHERIRMSVIDPSTLDEAMSRLRLREKLLGESRTSVRELVPLFGVQTAVPTMTADEFTRLVRSLAYRQTISK